jgi:tetratricopeptide (TPR) repeat protein
MAAYYNNVSSAYQELGDSENAEKACYDALAVLDGDPEYNGEIAVTHVNLAHIYYDADNFDERVYEHMEKAWELLMDSNNVHDGNFAFICSKCHPSFGFFGYFEYERTLKEITERIYEGN